MYIRLKFGRYAGEIRDIQAEAAHGLLRAGKAEDPYAPVVEVRTEMLAQLQTKFVETEAKPRKKAKR